MLNICYENVKQKKFGVSAEGNNSTDIKVEVMVRSMHFISGLFKKFCH